MTKRAGLFPTFFLSGFECSTFRWKDQGRRDLAAETGHYRQAREDYAQLRRWQRELNRVTELDDDPFSDPVELQDVIDAASRLRKQPDQNWH